ncbi:Ger(x)C family spore germination protein [Paenibacillus ihumii]|uniref:Ger(x)C family spore germination protein n=1 Tax=Paenibacillus ihumii TaxID=687436 RepID=UPI0006D840F5|nr:Ger(x)C family spore germination protein [Paenibacillus ihumii]
MSRHVRRVLLAAASLLLLISTGCWSANEIEDVTVSIGLGLDTAKESAFEKEINEQGAHYPKENVITATIQIIPPINAKKGGQGGGGGGGGGGSSPSSEKAYLNEQLTGDSVIQIFRQFSLRRDRPIIGHHLKVIVVARELAQKYSLEQIFDFILRDNEIRPSCLVVVSHRSALEALSSEEPGEIPALYLLGVVNNRYRSNKILPPVSLIKLDSAMQSGASFLLQNVVTAKDEHKFSGAAIIKGDTKRWIGELTQYDIEGLSWIKGDVVGGALKTYASRGSYTIAYEPETSKASIIPEVSGDDISFHIKIKTEGSLIEDWSFPEVPSSPQYIHELEGQFEEEIKKQIRQVLHKMQKVYHVDVGGFGEQLKFKYPKRWRKLKERWEDIFSHVPITYDVNVTIKDVASSTD